jgi:hypothetical protein
MLLSPPLNGQPASNTAAAATKENRKAMRIVINLCPLHTPGRSTYRIEITLTTPTKSGE